MLCFKCLINIEGDTKDLFKHLKYIHGIHSGTSTYIVCREEGCNLSFNYLSSYKRHLQAKHAQIGNKTV